MHETRVAKRYATALFNLAKRHDVVEEVDSQVDHLGSLFRDRRLVRLMTQPQIPQHRKEQVLMRVVGDRVHPLLLSTLKVMLRKRRIDQFAAVASYYDLLADRLRGVEEITVITAIELEDGDYQEILHMITPYSAHPKLRLVKKVRPEMVGGIVIELGRDKLIDQSLRTALDKLHRSMVKHRHY